MSMSISIPFSISAGWRNRNGPVEVAALLMPAVFLMVALIGCALEPARARLPVWVEAAGFQPAAEVTDAAARALPVPDGWSVWPHQVINASLSPQCPTNNAGAVISWEGGIVIDPPPGPHLFRIEYLADEFGPAFYPLYPDFEHPGITARWTIQVIWTQPYAFEPRVLIKPNTP